MLKFFSTSYFFLFFFLTIVSNKLGFFFSRSQSVSFNFVTREVSSATLQSEYIRNKLAH